MSNETNPFHIAFFNLEDIGIDFGIPLHAYVTGERWNGSLMPFFEFDEAMRACNEIIDNSADNVSFQSDTDTICFTQEGETEYFEGVDIVVNDEKKHVYPVGAGSWIWNEVEPTEAIEVLYKKIEKIDKELKKEYSTAGETMEASQLESQRERLENTICDAEDYVETKNEKLDILVYDSDWHIRRQVACEGRSQDLDILVYDESPEVRKIVAWFQRPQDLDILVHDKDSYVREEVAKHGRPEDLDILVHDSRPIVRQAVVEHGRPEDLDILVHDENIEVKETAQRQLDKSEPSLDSEAKDMEQAAESQSKGQSEREVGKDR